MLTSVSSLWFFPTVTQKNVWLTWLKRKFITFHQIYFASRILQIEHHVNESSYFCSAYISPASKFISPDDMKTCVDKDLLSLLVWLLNSSLHPSHFFSCYVLEMWRIEKERKEERRSQNSVKRHCSAMNIITWIIIKK